MDIRDLIKKMCNIEFVDIGKKAKTNLWIVPYHQNASILCGANIGAAKAHFEFVDNKEEFNARVTSYPGNFVGVNIATFWVLCKLSARLVRARVFPSIGNQQDPIWDPSGERSLQCDIDLIGVTPFDWDFEKAQWSDDPERLILFHLILGIMFDFIVLHELGHLANGHCTRDGALAMIIDPVFEMSGASSAGDVHSQARELIADHFAFEAILEITKARFAEQAASNPSAARVITKLANSDADVVGIVLTCLYPLFRVADRGDWQRAELSTLKHPPAPFRLRYIQALVIERFGDDYANIVKKAALSGDAILSVSLNVLPRPNWIEEMNSHLFFEHYCKIYKELPKWTRTGTARLRS